ncbi:hypothetical protein ACVFVO_12685 [Advenella kashmirensis]
MKVRRFVLKHCDQITLWLAVVTAVLAGAGGGLLYGSYDSNQNAEKRVDDANKVADKRVAEIQAINLSLIQTLQQKVAPLVTQQAEVVEQQSVISEKLDKATDRVETAATTATKAATRAGQAARRSNELKGSLRIAPSKPEKPRCRGKDVFGDPCP